MPPQFSLAKSRNGGPQLRMCGEFQRPLWIPYLFSGLSNLRVSVIRGTATRAANRDWNATFELDFRECTRTPENIDYLALSQQQAALASAPPTLSHFQITRRSDQSLEVLLQGPDQIGFLGGILTKLSMLTLFPIELEIDTVAGQIRDRIVFLGIGGMPPNESIENSLGAMLQDLIAPG
jgi:hypothetical protein